MKILLYLLLSYQIYPSLTVDAFHSAETFLIFHYIERENLRCTLCTAIERRLPELDIPIYTLNPYKEVYLGLCLFTTTFPAFTVHEKDRFYRLNVYSFEELKQIVNEKKWISHKQAYPNNLFTRICAYILLPFLYFYVRFTKTIETLPGWFLSMLFGVVGVFLFFSLFDIFTKE